MTILFALTLLAFSDDAAHTIDVAGTARSYKLHVPASVAADAHAPLVVVLHGGGGNANAIAQNSQFSEKADREKFIVAYPEGVGRQPNAYTWNAGHCCAFAMTSHSPDIEFLTRLLDDIAKVHPIDVKRIYFCGMSNGGMMTYRLLGSIANRIAAAGIVSGAMFARSAQTLPARPDHHLPRHRRSRAPLQRRRKRERDRRRQHRRAVPFRRSSVRFLGETRRMRRNRRALR